MSTPSLFERLKKARIVQVVVVYLAASWGVLQLVDTLMGMLSLPEWLGPVTVVLLGVGLLVVGATAWVQSLESTTRAEQAGQVPTDWEVAPADVVASLRAGKLPHLTWGRAILGGVVALSLAMGAAGAYVLLTGGEGLIGPQQAGAEASATAVAVLPFTTRGEGLELYGEGMVDLLTANLEGLGGLRTINSGTVVARWRSEIGETQTAELDRALGVAGSLNARYAIRGGVLDAGGRVRLTAEVFDLADGSRVEGVQVEGASDDMLGLIDALTVQLATVFVGGRGLASGGTRALSTPSVAALEAYLRGEALYRQQLFEEAIEAFSDATRADSTFALAWWRLSEAWGWLDPGEPVGVAALARANAVADELPPRERLLLRADAGLQGGHNAAISELRTHLQLHSEDAEAWNLLGEYAVHASHLTGAPPDEYPNALRRATALMPTFSPYYIHLAGWAINERLEEDFAAVLAEMREANTDDPLLEAWPRSWDFYWGSDAEMAEAEAYFRGASMVQRNALAMGALNTDAAGRSVASMGLFTREIVQSAFPFTVTATEMSAGWGPDRWTERDLSRTAPTHVHWTLLTGQLEPGLTLLSSSLAGEPTPAEAVSAAVLAAWVGDDALRARALAALPDTAWAGPFGIYGGAADAAEAERTVRAVSHLRLGEPAAAVPLLAETLTKPRYDALAVYLMGLAQADMGNWPEAIRHWETLLRGFFRSHVRLGLARAHEALGDADAALEGYRGFLMMFEGADPDLAPVVEAREAVARLGG